MNRLKLIVKVLVLILILGMAFSSEAQTEDVEVQLVSSRDSVKTEGELVRMPVIMDTIFTTNVAGENIISMNLDFTHSAILTPVGFSTENGLIDSWSFNTNVNEASNEFRFTAAGTSPITLDSGLLFYVDFEIGEVTRNTNVSFSLSTAAQANNEFNEGGYTITMESGIIQVLDVAQLSVSASPARITTGDSTRINVSGGEAPYSYSLEDDSFGSIVSENYFLAARHGIAQVNVEDANGLLGEVDVEVRAFRLGTVVPEDPIFPGDDFNAYITTTDLSGLEVISGEFRFSFANTMDISVSELITDGTVLEGVSVELNEVNHYTYDVAFATTSPLSVGDTLLGITFNSSEEASRSYSFTVDDNAEFNEGLLGNKAAGPSIQFVDVVAPSISNPSGNYIAGDQVQFTGSGGTAPYSWSVSDGDVATIDTEGLLTVLTGGIIDVVIADDLGISSSKQMSFFDGRVTLLSQGSPPGSTFDIPLVITEFPTGREFSAFEMDVTYNPSQITFLEVVKAGSLTSDFSIVSNPLDENTIRIAAASSEVVTGPGDLLYLSFEIDNMEYNQTSSLTIDRIVLNEGSPVADRVNGTLRSVEVPTTSDFTVEADEDQPYTFDASDFPFSHPNAGESLSGVRFPMLPESGELNFNGTEVSTTRTYATAEIPQLTYQNDLNENGDDYTAFPFFTVDQAGIVSNRPAVLTVNVAAVNDSPSFQLSEESLSADEDFAGTLTTVIAADEVPLDEQGETVTYSIDPPAVDFADVVFDTETLTVSVSAVADSSGTQVFEVSADDGQAENNVFTRQFTLTVNAVDDAPAFDDQVFEIVENSANETVVGTIVAEDIDNELEFTIESGNIDEAFIIDNDSRELRVNNVNALDFETNPSFGLTVTLPGDPDSFSALITVNLTDVDENVNQAPQILDQTFSVDENSADGTVVGTVDSFDPDGDALTFSITAGNISSAFALDAVTGELTVNDGTILDFETTPTFSLTVEVSDGGLTDDATITIDLNDVFDTNVAPEINDQVFSVAENSANGSAVGAVSATDANGDELSFSILSGNTNGAFELSTDGELTVGNVTELDFEISPSFDLIVEVSDGLLSASATITVDLTDVDESVNQAPQILDQTFAVDENSADGTVVGTVDSFDPDGDALTFSITAGNTSSAFALDAVTGELTVNDETILDFETTPTFSLTVEVSDGVLTDDATMTIDLNDVNDTNVAPEIVDQTFSIAENSVNGSFVGAVSASDANGDILTFSILSGNTNDAFDLSTDGDLTVGNATELDFETSRSFDLIVEVTDGLLSASATITVDLTDVDESVNQAPQILDQTFSVDENSANGTAVGSVASFDPDGDALTFSITAGNTNDAFDLSADGDLTVGNAAELDFETTPSFSLTVEVSDGALSASATITIDLIDIDETVNQAPQILDQTFSLDENSAVDTSVGVVAATDPDGDALIYSITLGNDLGGFSIEAATGELSVADASVLDFETNPSFGLTIEVSDGVLSATALITINLNDLNENVAPSISDQTFSVDENSALNTSVGVVAASDPDGDALTYSIIAGNDLGGFDIDGATGEILVADGTVLDFETNPSFGLTIEVSDGSLSASALVTINLNDVFENSAPTVVDQTFSIDENSAVDTSVGVVAANDPDGDALFFSITSGNDLGGFSIETTTGELIVADESVLDFETTPSFGLTVEVSDGDLTASALVTVNLNDLFENSAPTITDQTFSVDENSTVNTSVGIVTASDPDGDALFFSIIAGNDLGGFSIETASGELRVADEAVMDFETTPSFSLTVEVSDGDLSSSATVTVDLNDVDENTLSVGTPQDDFLVYPNPVADKLSVELKAPLEHLSIYDVSGVLTKKYLKPQCKIF